jgi:hypothetical protein
MLADHRILVDVFPFATLHMPLSSNPQRIGMAMKWMKTCRNAEVRKRAVGQKECKIQADFIAYWLFMLP